MKINGVVLAAGLSSRAGVYKLALKLRDKTIIENCIEGMYNICSKTIVVGGYNYEIISGLLQKYSKVEVVYNEIYKEGMFSSVKKGIKHVDGERFFLIPGDYPLVREETYRRMLNKEDDIVVPVYDGIKGHPVLIKSKLINDIVDNEKNISLKEFIDAYGFSTISVNDPGTLLDVDTIDDYNNIINNKRLMTKLNSISKVK